MTWDEAMDKYGSDKPDLRFGMELINMTDAVKGSDFKVFNDIINKGGIRAMQAFRAASLTGWLTLLLFTVPKALPGCRFSRTAA